MKTAHARRIRRGIELGRGAPATIWQFWIATRSELTCLAFYRTCGEFL